MNGFIQLVYKFLQNISFEIPTTAKIAVNDWVPTRKHNRYWVEFSVDRETAVLMEEQRRDMQKQLVNYNLEKFNDKAHLYVSLKSISNFASFSHKIGAKVGQEDDSEDDWMDLKIDDETEDNQSLTLNNSPKSYPYKFRIEHLPVRYGQIQESAVTEFLTSLGLPSNVSFDVFSFESTANFELRCNAVIGVEENVKDVLIRAKTREILFKINREKFDEKSKYDYIKLSRILNPREKAIQEIIDVIGEMLNYGRIKEEFHAIHLEGQMKIYAHRTKTRTLTVKEVIVQFPEEYNKALQSCSKQTCQEMNLWEQENNLKRKQKESLEDDPEDKKVRTAQ
uniref:Uncharacterized protein n=1 Tax=Caenorhabditis japonica TaxID=281687 RepID=A0A8R1ISC4_CAEJA